MKFGLIVNQSKPDAVSFARELCAWKSERGSAFLTFDYDNTILGQVGLSRERWLAETETAILIGGDGTFLRAAHFLRDTGINLFGICLGYLGFMAAGDSRSAHDDISQIERGDFKIEQRYFLEGEIVGSAREQNERAERAEQFANKNSEKMFALNEFVLSRGAYGHPATIGVEVRNRQICEYRADGVILSSPTGSTAYALSAGGPIVPPDFGCMIMVPVCAHTLCARPALFAPSDVLTLRSLGKTPLTLSADGEEAATLNEGDLVRASLSCDHSINVIALPQYDYYRCLREKLMWGWNPVSERGTPRA